MDGWCGLIADAAQIPLPEGTWDRAWATGVAISQRSRNRQTTSRWGRVELSTHGYICEAGLASWLGVPYDFPTEQWRRPDVAGFEVKGTCWSSLESLVFHEGGNWWVPSDTEASAVVCMSCFAESRKRKVYLDGWLPMAQIRGRREWRTTGKGGRGTSFRVPYGALRSWRSLEVPARAGQRCDQRKPEMLR